ncbi:ABC transporter ATP-binding protein [Streptomyces sp. NPDC088726]|uniref:ABC transporter ATP-binding protein n=1 Tax=Streptomyces sp. NPDC088726 TaxID=3365874 RepID=UPI00380FF971
MTVPESARSLSLWVATAFRAAPGSTVALSVSVTLQALAAPAQSYGLALLLDGITQHDRGTINLAVALIVAALFTVSLITSLSLLLEHTLSDQVHGHVHSELLEMGSGIPGIEHHEDPKVADRLAHVLEDVDDMAHSAHYMMQLVAAAVGMCSALALLASVHPALMLLPVAGLTRVCAAAVSARMRHRAVRQLMPRIRVFKRIVAIAAKPPYGAEIRSFGMRPFLLRRLHELSTEFNTAERHAALRGRRYELASRLPFGVLYGASIMYVVQLARYGSATAGDVALVITLAPALDASTRMMALSMGTVANMVQVFGRFRWLHDYAAAARARQTGDMDAPAALHQGIALRDAGFSYPRAERAALSGITLELPAGSTVALVGENGAGKSTLVKLLGRLYDVTEGTIEVDGTDIRSIDLDAWRARASACFQDFARFEFTAGESIGVGDLPHIDDRAAVWEATARAGALEVVERLPHGFAQRLGKRFSGGTELSGGQWQRLALARACMRRQPLLLLLDEPASALDPETESALFERFADASHEAARRCGAITVLVSHRFSTVRMADLVVVMDGGRIVECGSHNELIAADGRYAELFGLQAKVYR